MNQTLFAMINSYAGKNRIIDTAAVFCGEYLPLLLIAFLIYLWLFKRELREELLMAVAGVLFALTANLVIIMNYYHPRPFMDHTVTQLIAHAPETSFPSDHATFMFTLSFMLATSRRLRAIGVPFVVLSLVCSLSRVFCGVHYPLDIAGSLMVALITAGLFRSPSSRRISLLITHLLGKFDIIAAKLTVARRH